MLRPFALLASAALLCVGYVGVRALLLPAPEEGTLLREHDVVLVDAPERTTRGWRATGRTTIAGEDVRVRLEGVGGVPDIRAGAEVAVSGSFRRPQSSPLFPEVGYFRAHGLAGRVVVERIVAEGTEVGSVVSSRLGTSWQWLLSRLARALMAPADALAAGLLFGLDVIESETLTEAFRRTGMNHVLVASGTNVVILLAVVVALRARASVALVLVTLFALVAGAEASIVRASLFGGAFVLARLIGRRAHAPTTIAAVAFGMGVLNPWVLLYDVGFQLSFGAVIGLTTLGGWLRALLSAWSLREYLASTLAAQLATLPVVVYHFGQIALIAPVANLILGPIIPVLMATSAIALVFPWLRLVAWVAQGLAQLFVWGTVMLASLPWAALAGDARQLGWLVLTALPFVLCLLAARRWAQREVEPSPVWYAS
ncbi:MAG: ComEC/Rec2 family competence protein [Patescibacteria group bacterium]|jgi:competence protein ComEC